MDRATNRYFYIDHIRAVTQWTPPVLPSSARPPGMSFQNNFSVNRIAIIVTSVGHVQSCSILWAKLLQTFLDIKFDILEECSLPKVVNIAIYLGLAWYW